MIKISKWLDLRAFIGGTLYCLFGCREVRVWWIGEDRGESGEGEKEGGDGKEGERLEREEREERKGRERKERVERVEREV